jgi:hypothetical protein
MSRMARWVMAVAVLACSTNASAGQGMAQPPAELPRVDVVASVSFRQVAANAGALTHWTGPGFSLTVNGNVSGNVAITSSVEKFSAGRAAVLAGLQLSTSFYYGSGRDATPGRFFAKFLAGVSGVGSTDVRGAGQLDVGADILLSTRKPVGFRWEVGYDFIPGDPLHHAYGRAAVGLVFGPRI